MTNLSRCFLSFFKWWREDLPQPPCCHNCCCSVRGPTEPSVLSSPPPPPHKTDLVHLHNHSYALLLVWHARTRPLRRQRQCQGVLICLKVTFSWSSVKITPDLVGLTSKQNYPWKEKNRPEFLEKDQQPKDKMQTESVMVHSRVSGNLTKGVSVVSVCTPNGLPSNLELPRPSEIANPITRKVWGRDSIS